MTVGTNEPFHAVNDYPCESCGHPMRCRLSRAGDWFYGCSQWPRCNFTFDADQQTGSPIVHMRFGIPFRTNLERVGGLFAALQTSPFELVRGESLAASAETSRQKRATVLKEEMREAVLVRVNKAAPKTREEWIKVILSERLQAIQEYETDETRKLTRLPRVFRQ